MGKKEQVPATEFNENEYRKHLSQAKRTSLKTAGPRKPRHFLESWTSLRLYTPIHVEHTWALWHILRTSVYVSPTSAVRIRLRPSIVVFTPLFFAPVLRIF